MLLIVNLDNTPGVGTAADVATIRGLNKLIRANNGKRYFAGNFLCLSNSLLILVLVSRRLENLDVMVGNIGKNLTECVSGIDK